MKKLLLILLFLPFIFSCGNAETKATHGDKDHECTSVCSKYKSSCTELCQKACCLGCKATEGEKRCIVLEDGFMPCCTVDNTADIEYEEGYGEGSHEGHDH